MSQSPYTPIGPRDWMLGIIGAVRPQHFDEDQFETQLNIVWLMCEGLGHDVFCAASMNKAWHTFDKWPSAGEVYRLLSAFRDDRISAQSPAGTLDEATVSPVDPGSVPVEATLSATGSRVAEPGIPG